MRYASAVAVTVAEPTSVALVIASTSLPGFSPSETPVYGHPLNTDTSLLWTVCFVPGERKPLHFLQIINKDTPLIRTLSIAPLCPY